ncbi:MAG: ATP-dependent Clp protease ATP-binding subunit, partial [Verrucomicrobia bacterium]|nr:ATP-dependent Clp protease ATP-binding subunit [Verrucomicrobiota bacterium]
PEFINRLDDVIYMNFLTPEVVAGIARNQIKRVSQQLVERGKSLEVSAAAFEQIIREGYSAQYGARFLNRTIENRVLKPVAKFLFERPAATKLLVDVAGNGTTVAEV